MPVVELTTGVFLIVMGVVSALKPHAALPDPLQTGIRETNRFTARAASVLLVFAGILVTAYAIWDLQRFGVSIAD